MLEPISTCDEFEKIETFLKRKAWRPNFLKNDTNVRGQFHTFHHLKVVVSLLYERTYFRNIFQIIMVGTNFTFFNWGFFWKIFFYQAAQDSQHVNMPEAKDNFEVVEVLLVGKGYDKVLWPPGWQVKDHKKKICGFCIYLWEEEVKSNPVEFFLSWLPPIHLIFSTRHSMVSTYIGQSLVHNFRL